MRLFCGRKKNISFAETSFARNQNEKSQPERKIWRGESGIFRSSENSKAWQSLTSSQPDRPTKKETGHIIDTKKGSRHKMNVNKLILPQHALTNQPPHGFCVDDASIKRVLYPPIRRCEHCCLLDAEFGCVLEKFNGEYSLMCDDVIMFLSPRRFSLQRERRYAMYYFMAVQCLYPIGLQDLKKLPVCVVDDIQTTFPEPDNSHLQTEAQVYFYRHQASETILYMEFRCDPLALPYPWHSRPTKS